MVAKANASDSVVIESLEIADILSFGPDSPPIDLGQLNVFIGPNASVKHTHWVRGASDVNPGD